MEGSKSLVKVAGALGAAALLAIVIRRLQHRQKELSQPPAAEEDQRQTQARQPQKEKPDSRVTVEQKAPSLAEQRKSSPLAPNFDLPLEQDIERRLRERYKPSYLDIENQGASCSALKVAVVMVSEAFRGQSRINRQREVQSILRPDLDSGRLH
eukprot:CAMPEP_0115086792 /NCGR_PEP_ID=MMETSP0227-20121206/22827_1 /TAXON_ID=89957 /ORGANISM="Polarella glacialis, Strain CCMP 1383" /LENGTH=153 /DNA_ID=CAMNT_0002476379 /DNA_START=133 /DNA_END=591 /DNA_ORIENTATION=-